MAKHQSKKGDGSKASRRPPLAPDGHGKSFQSDQAKEKSRKAGAVRQRRIGGALRSEQQRQQKRRDSR